MAIVQAAVADAVAAVGRDYEGFALRETLAAPLRPRRRWPPRMLR
jgi:hypothetical protein